MTNDNILFRHKLQLVNAYRSARRTLGILLLLRRLEDLMLSQFLQVSYPLKIIWRLVVVFSFLQD